MERVYLEVWRGKKLSGEPYLFFPSSESFFSLFTFPSQHYSEYPGALLNEAILISDRYSLTRHPII